MKKGLLAILALIMVIVLIPAAGAQPSVDLAYQKPVTASSVENAGHLADYAVDGQSHTRWSSQYSDHQWISVDLGAPQMINSVKLNWEVAYGKSYEIQVSNDNWNWTTVYSNASGDGGIDEITITPTEARYVKMYGIERGTIYGFSLWSFEVYGSGQGGTQPTPSPAPTAELGTPASGFYVQGTTLYDENGVPFIMRGINHAHTWYKDQLHVALPAIAATGANTVRIVLSDGQQWQKDSLSSIESIIALAKQHHLVVVLEVHDGTGSNSAQVLDQIADYWIEMKQALIGNEDTVIVNIANEWYGSWEGAAWADGYKQVIPKLRAAGIQNTLMVDSAGWGQYPQSIVDYGIEVFNSDPLQNTMFSIHMYEYAGGNETMVRNHIDNVLAQNLTFIIGEFGIKHSDGDVDEQTIMSYSQQKGVGYLAWSWKGNSGGVEYLDMVVDWAGTQLTEQGLTIIEGSNGIRATSQRATIYE